MADYTGQLLGNYEVRERLGRGGMAEVYKAYHPNLNRHVAIKILHAHLADAPDFIGRFRREAQAVAQLHHPHIVQIFDFDARADLIYMVMEYVDGPSLKTRLDDLYRRGERLPLPEVIAIFRALLDAVGYAHSQGMVHRDLKPANVMLAVTDDDRRMTKADTVSRPLSFRPVLTDFGIAKILGADAQRFTATNAVIGTPTYMSPEQGQGHGGDERSDLYALGIMLYECLTGQVPYEGDTSVSVLLKHVTAPIPFLRALRPDLPAALEQIVWTALAKDPLDRFQTASEFWEALAKIENHGEQTTEAASRRTARPITRPAGTVGQWFSRRPARFSAIAIGLIVLAIAIAGYAWWPKAGGPSPAVSEGQQHLAEGNFQLAADSFSLALTQTPDNVEALLGHAQAAEGVGLPDEALLDIERVIVIAPQLALGYRERARLTLQYSEFEVASVLADLDKAIELAGNDSAEAARAHFTRGWAIINFALIEDRLNPAAALDNLRQAVALEAQNSEAQFTLARALLATGQPAEALTPANRAIELAPDSALYRKVRAHIYFTLKDLLAAYDDLTAALEHETVEQTLAVLYAERAYLSLALGNRAAAEADVQTAVTYDAQILIARVLQARLDPTQPAVSPEELANGAVLDDPIWQAILAWR